MRPLFLLIATAVVATQAYAADVVGFYKAKVEVPTGVKVKPAQQKINQSMERSLRFRLRNDGTWDGGTDNDTPRGTYKVDGKRVTLFDTATTPDGKPLINMQLQVSQDGNILGPLYPPKNKQYVIYVRSEMPKKKGK